ncbi:MAG: translocation/assembly module TamB domain-containing protein [Sandaracinaceae bacterium]
MAEPAEDENEERDPRVEELVEGLVEGVKEGLTDGIDDTPAPGAIQRWGRRLGVSLVWMLVVSASLVFSLAYHLQLPFAGVVALESVTELLNDTLAGSFEIGRMHNVTWEKVVAENIVIRDPQGREVVRVDRLAAWPDFESLLAGTIRVSRVRVRGGRVTLIPGDEDDESQSAVSIADTFLPVESEEDDGDGSGEEEETSIPRILIEGIVLDEVLVVGDVPGYEGLRVEDVRVEGRVEVQEDASTLVQVYGGRGEMTGPYAGTTHVERIVGHVNGDMREGLEFYARAHRGDDRLRARLRITIPEEDATPEMDLRVWVEPWQMATLADMEVAPGLDVLDGTFRGYARMHGPVDELELRGDLTSEAGRVHVRGRFPTDGAIEIGARTDGPLRLAELVPAAPPIHVEGDAQLTLDLDAEERHLIAEIEPLVVADIALPAFRIDAMIEDDRLRITELEAPHLGGQVEGRGTVGYDGTLDVHVSARIPEISRDPNVRRLAPGARGAVTAELDVQSDEAAENLRIDGRVGLRGARYGSVRASSVNLRGRVAGLGPAPELHATGDADGLVVGELALGHATVSIDGGPGGYALRAETRNSATGTHFLVDGRAHSSAGALRLDAPTLLADLGDGEPWRGEVDLTLRPGHSVTVDEFALTRQNEGIEAEATYRFNGNDDASVRLTGVDLTALRPLAPTSLEGLSGTLDGQVRLGGDLDRSPRGTASLRLRDGGIRSLRGIDGTVRLALEDDGLTSDIDLDIGESGQLAVRGPVALDPQVLLRSPERIAEAVALDALTAQADNLDLGLLSRLGLVDELPVQGRVSTQIAFSGTGADLGFRDVFLVLDHVGLPDWDPLRAKLHLSLGDGRLIVRSAWVADEVGPLAQAQADLPLSLDDPPESAIAFYAQLRESVWSASARLEGRRLDRWPRPVRDMIPIDGVRLSASLTAEGTEDGPSARLATVAQFVEAATDSDCGREVRPVVTVDASLDDQHVVANLRGFVGDASAEIGAQAEATLPFDEWIASGVRTYPETSLTAHVRNADLADVPYLCEYGRGELDLEVRASDVLTAAPTLHAELDAPHLRLWERSGEQGEAHLSDDYRVHVTTAGAPDSVSACLVIGIASEPGTAVAECEDAAEAAPRELLSRARLPVTWTEGEVLPAYTAGATISSWTDLSDAQVEPVLTFIPGIVTGRATMDGNIEVRGPLERIQLNGELDMREGEVQLEGLGQHLHDIQGRVELHGDEVLFPPSQPLTVVDSGGRAQLHGSVGFEGIVPRRLDLVLSADSFPIRREGMILASLSGGATVGGSIFDDHLNSTITISPRSAGEVFDVQLPEQTAGTLQALGDHRDVLVVGTRRTGGGEVQDESYPIEIRINANRPFQVRRTDFNARLTADLTATYQDPDLRIRGEAIIQRGIFEILGKRFELVRGGTLTFRGRPELNPQINIDANYEVGTSSTVVTVQVRGTLAHPVIEFTTNDSDITDRAEIISLLIAGGRREVGTAEQEASQQAASFISGMTAGILTLGLRQEFGDIIPLLAIEPEASGTRVRVGFNANEIIPEILRGIITGAYIEGFLTASQASNAAGGSAGTGGVGGGVSVEFTFPYNLLMRGTYVPVDNGSLDVLFEP